MFFLKELPTKKMIESYTNLHQIKSVSSIESALFMMRQASLLIRQLEAYFSNHDTSQLRFLILIVIDREPERKSLLVNEISERIDVSRPVITRTLQRLIDDGLITMKTDNLDGRAKQVSLTVRGRLFLEAMLPGYFTVISDFMSELEA